MLKIMNEEVDYDKLPKDNVSLVEIISVKSDEDLSTEKISVVDIDTEFLFKISRRKSNTDISDADIFSFLDSEFGETDLFSSDCVSHDYYTSNKQRNSGTTTDSAAATSNSTTTTGSTNVDSGIDSHD